MTTADQSANDWRTGPIPLPPDVIAALGEAAAREAWRIASEAPLPNEQTRTRLAVLMRRAPAPQQRTA